MDELLEFCARMLGEREAGARVAQSASAQPGEDRLLALGRAVAACRQAGPGHQPAAGAGPQETADLAGAVAAELAAATARLPQRQREALALRELLRCTHREVAAVIGIGPMAVAPLLARARLRLRSELRGTAPASGDCPERDRALRTIALRQDGEPVPAADDDWLLEHLGHCTACGQAHSAMLEASVCYRAWRIPAGAGSSTGPAAAVGAHSP
jgi:hypothetical protein